MSTPAAGPVAAVATLLALVLLPVVSAPHASARPADDRTADLTLTLRDAWWDRQTSRSGPSAAAPSTAAAASAVAVRPTTPDAEVLWAYPDDVEVMKTCNDRICVHHVTNGQHASSSAWAARALRHLEVAWRRLVDRLEFRPPAPDNGNGGDDRFDVYLADVSAIGQYGFCAPESVVGGQDRRASAYCVLDNDMAGLPGRPDDNLAVTAAHELFHAIQFNMDITEDTWFMEATATWAEHHVFGALRANRQYLREGQIGTPSRPLDSQAGMYGNWLFVRWLVQRHGVGTVRAVWRRLDATVGRPDEWSVQGIARHLRTRGGTWAETYRAFTEANAFPARHRGIDGLGRLRPAADTRLRLDRRRTQRRRTLHLDHLTSRTAVVRVAPAARRGRVQLVLRTARPAHTVATVVLVRKDGTHTRRKMKPARAGKHRGRAVVRFRAAGVRRAVVVVANTSHVYRSCRHSSGWACGGHPVHDDTRVRLRARLV